MDPMNHSMTVQQKNLLLLGFIILKFLVQYWVNGSSYELHRDEFLHLDQAHHLAWGFQSVPPFNSWVAWIILQLGNGVFWVKFFPALFGALTTALVWKTVETLKGNTFALVMAAIAMIFSIFLRINLLFQPNSADILFWTLTFYGVIKYIQQEDSKWLYWTAFAIAVGFLNKYSILFLVAGLIPALLLSRQFKMFRNKHFYIAMLLALIIISPNLWWQVQNNFPVVGHMKELASTQLVNVSRLAFLKSQFMAFIGASIIIIASLISLGFSPLFKRYRFVVITYVVTIGLFIFTRGKDYYAFGLYPILIAFGSVYIASSFTVRWKKYLPLAVIAIVLLFFYPLLKISLPTKSPAQFYADNKLGKPFSDHTWEDGRHHPISQDFADMLGWKELARKTDSVYAMIGDKQHVMVLADNYGQAGAINYYSKNKDIHVVSGNADYLHWFDFSRPIYSVIVIHTAPDPIETALISRLFSKISLQGQINNPYAREFETKIYLMENPTMDVRKAVEGKIKSMQAE